MAKKKTVEHDVYQLALDRVRWCYDNHDLVVVAFSGGKDSTVCLNLSMEIAGEKGRLPAVAYHFDEEAIPPETVDYVGRVAANPKVNLHWLCVPMEARNTCSRKSPLWYPWAAEDREKWVRTLPEQAITEDKIPGFQRGSGQDIIGRYFGPSFGSVCVILGIRAQESLTRYRIIARKAGRGLSCFYNQEDQFPHVTRAFAIYDWTVEDVWLYPQRRGIDYNRAYDVMQAAGLSRGDARCSPPFGEQPIRGLWRFKTCWPELWAKMVGRVPGAATAARYANTELYGKGILTKSDELSWQTMVEEGLAKLPDEAQAEVADALDDCFVQHHRYTNDAIPDDEPHPDSGFCWRLMYSVVAAGGNKLGRQSQRMTSKALNFRNQQKSRKETTGV